MDHLARRHDAVRIGDAAGGAHRTALGIVSHRALIDGVPHGYTKLRATYFHEVDSAFGFTDFNNPEFMRAACRIQYTFHWFYADDRHIAYFNSGINPVRSKKAHPDLPIPGRRAYEWRGWTPPPLNVLRGATPTPQNISPRTNLSRTEPCRKHPQVVDQKYLTNWNNKSAKGFRSADGRFGYGPIYRSLRLERRIRHGIRGSRRMSLPELVDAMEDAGTVDLRGSEVLPVLLKVIKPRRVSTPRLREALSTLAGWARRGAHRRDRNADGTYEDADAVRIMDAWWPRLLAAEFRPTLGADLFGEVQRMIAFHDAPRAQGSAFQTGWYGYVHKDLRMLLAKQGKKKGRAARAKRARKRIKSRFSRVYCGGGRKRVCRERLLDSLADALDHASDAEVYPGQPDGDCAGLGDAQWCTDAVRHVATGAITQPPIHWIDRPTFQQAVEIRGHR